MPDLNPTCIYVDADACPVKDEIYRVAGRHGLPVSVVAGNFIRVPQDPLIERVAAGFIANVRDLIRGRNEPAAQVRVAADFPAARLNQRDLEKVLAQTRKAASRSS